MDDFEKEIRDALEDGARWQGSPDDLWGRIRTRIEPNGGSETVQGNEHQISSGVKLRRTALVTAAALLVIVVGLFFTGALDKEGSSYASMPILWVVPYENEVLPATAYAVAELRSVSTSPGGTEGDLMKVAVPGTFEEIMAQDDGEIATIVLHIDVLDDMPVELVRHHFERGVQVVLLGGSMRGLAEWLGTHPFSHVFSLDRWIGGYHEPEVRGHLWPISRMVQAAECGGESTLVVRSVDGEWASLDQLMDFVENDCNEQRLALYDALRNGPEPLEVQEGKDLRIRRWLTGTLLHRDGDPIALTRDGDPFPLMEEILDLRFESLDINYPLAVARGDIQEFAVKEFVKVFDLAERRLLLSAAQLGSPLVEAWPRLIEEPWFDLPDDFDDLPEGPHPTVGDISRVAYSPDQDQLAFLVTYCNLGVASCYGAAGIIDLASGDAIFLRTVNDSPRIMAWSPGGEYVAYGTTSGEQVTIYIDSAVEHRPIVHTDAFPTNAQLLHLEWTDDDQLAVTTAHPTTGDSQRWLLDVSTGELRSDEGS